MHMGCSHCVDSDMCICGLTVRLLLWRCASAQCRWGARWRWLDSQFDSPVQAQSHSCNLRRLCRSLVTAPAQRERVRVGCVVQCRKAACVLRCPLATQRGTRCGRQAIRVANEFAGELCAQSSRTVRTLSTTGSCPGSQLRRRGVCDGRTELHRDCAVHASLSALINRARYRSGHKYHSKRCVLHRRAPATSSA